MEAMHFFCWWESSLLHCYARSQDRSRVSGFIVLSAEDHFGHILPSLLFLFVARVVLYKRKKSRELCCNFQAVLEHCITDYDEYSPLS